MIGAVEAGVEGVEVGVEAVIGGSFRWGWGWGNGWFLFGSMVGKWTGVKSIVRFCLGKRIATLPFI